jgi:serine/threonine-protein kinase
MAVVVAAHHLQLDEKVALKFLLPEALSNPEAVARFMREARAAVKIKSEHVARVTDVGQLASGATYIVMEYLEGSDLAQWLEQRGQLPIEQAADFVLQACEAIAEAHALGIVHRDLKPSNLFCIRRPDGRLSIKVLDFGISKVTAAAAVAHDITRTSALVGSPLYMSPEQMVSSKNIDARTDVWSLGTILFELVTGQPPFSGQSVTELAVRVSNDPPTPMRSLRSDVPPGLEQVITTCLQKQRERRYPNVGDLAVALREFGSERARASVERILDTLRSAGISDGRAGRETHALVSAVPSATAHGVSGSTAASWGSTGATSSRSRKAMVAGGAVLSLLLLAGGAFVVARRPVPAAVPSAGFDPTPSVGVVTPSPSSPPQAALADVPIAAASAVSPLATALPAPPARTSAPAPAARTGPARPPARSPGIPSASPKPNCNPPWVIDSAGDRQYKPECL